MPHLLIQLQFHNQEIVLLDKLVYYGPLTSSQFFEPNLINYKEPPSKWDHTPYGTILGPVLLNNEMVKNLNNFNIKESVFIFPSLKQDKS